MLVDQRLPPSKPILYIEICVAKVTSISPTHLASSQHQQVNDRTIEIRIEAQVFVMHNVWTECVMSHPRNIKDLAIQLRLNFFDPMRQQGRRGCKDDCGCPQSTLHQSAMYRFRSPVQNKIYRWAGQQSLYVCGTFQCVDAYDTAQFVTYNSSTCVLAKFVCVSALDLCTHCMQDSLFDMTPDVYAKFVSGQAWYTKICPHGSLQGHRSPSRADKQNVWTGRRQQVGC